MEMSEGIKTSSNPEKEALRAVSEEAVPPSFGGVDAHPIRAHWAKSKRTTMAAKDAILFISITS
jgi:hypothetical protein